MKIGDKVRFLNEVGGGIVRGFEKGDIVIVEDSDGFDIPIPSNQCVVVGSATDTKEDEDKAYAPPTKMAKPQPQPEATEPEVDIADRPRTFIEERRGGDTLNACLCFVPNNPTAISRTSFDVYLVNDTNYFLNYAYLSIETGAAMLRANGTAKPNTKVLLETVKTEDLSELQHLCVQLMAYKIGKPFLLKPVVSVQLRPDLTKFYKIHTFTPNDFFDERVLTFDLVRGDNPVGRITNSALGQADETTEPLPQSVEMKPGGTNRVMAIRKQKPDEGIVVDMLVKMPRHLRGQHGKPTQDYLLDVFRNKMATLQGRHGVRAFFVYGREYSFIRPLIESETRRAYKWAETQDASFAAYNYGATLVIVK